MERYWDTRCKFCWSCVVATLLCSSMVPPTIALSHPDFLNIDCGATDTYVDPVTGLTWVPDTAYISTGKVGRPAAVSAALRNFTELKVLRYFDDLRPKNCFTLPVGIGGTYLLRATFFYGNYDYKNQPPSFQVALDADVMDNVTAPSPSDLANSGQFHYVEFHYVAQGSESILCLLRTSAEETPFISGISLKPASAMTKGYLQRYGDLLQEGRVMKTGIRVSYGETRLIRAPDDFYDRFWFPESPYLKLLLSPTTSPMEFLSTTSVFSDLVDATYYPPSSVMQTAVTSNGTLASLLNYPGFSNKSLYIMVYFGELIQDTETLVSRNFTLNALGGSFSINIEVEFLSDYSINIYNPSFIVEANSTMTIVPIIGAVKGPILNAMEVFEVSNLRLPKTIKRDALAIEDIKKNLNLREWTGDPCLPTPHSWVGCIPPDVTTPEPQIISMNLSRYHLEGSIPKSFANLLALTNLNLEDNNLSGHLPEFLTTLPKLRVLSIQNNDFSGSIPAALLAADSPILFTYRPGNPHLGVFNESSKKSPSVGVIIGATIGSIVGALLILVAAIIAYRRWNRKAKSISHEGTRLMKIATVGAAKAYSRVEVDVATNNLSKELGRGGFGPVYHGILPDGKEVAVKVADKSSKQGEKEFFNEVDVLSRVHHKNLVALVGYCHSEHDSILIYEYVPNGSLYHHLHGSAQEGNTLNWKMRLHIGLNAAQGLEYLHTGCCPSFIHRDVKSGNILLTLKFDAKVADFGLTRFMGETEDTRVLTSIMGTVGYLDPEYYTTHYLHAKSDVYSFGVVLLELITGRMPIDQSLVALGKNSHITNWVREGLQNNGMDSILAPAVKASNPNMEAVWKVVEIALQSVELKASHRPSMTQVVHELQGALTLEGELIVRSEMFSRYVDDSPRREMEPSRLPNAEVVQ